MAENSTVKAAECRRYWKRKSPMEKNYRLWRSAGKPDLDYPKAENDKYLLHVEINGYLAPLGMTDFNLTGICGFEPAAQKLYGGKKKRGAWIDALRESGGNEALSAAVSGGCSAPHSGLDQ